MSTEPRRVRKILRRLPVPAGEVEAKPIRRSAEHVLYAKPRAVEGFVTLSQLAVDRGIQPQLARLWVQKAGIHKHRNRWMWKTDSRDLARARKALGMIEPSERKA